jgi:hypothetical protein
MKSVKSGAKNTPLLVSHNGTAPFCRCDDIRVEGDSITMTVVTIHSINQNHTKTTPNNEMQNMLCVPNRRGRINL